MRASRSAPLSKPQYSAVAHPLVTELYRIGVCLGLRDLSMQILYVISIPRAVSHTLISPRGFHDDGVCGCPLGWSDSHRAPGVPAVRFQMGQDAAWPLWQHR